MRLIAAISTAVFVVLAIGLFTNVIPRHRTRRTSAPQVSERQQWLIQAGLDLTPQQFVFASAAAGILAFFLLLLITGVATVSLAPAVLLAFVPRIYFGRVRERRMTEVQRAWPDGLRDLVASISSGMSLQRAIEQMALSGPEPLKVAFSRFSFLARTVGMVPALEIVKEELADPTSDRVIEVLILAHERGGSIVPEILRDLAAATTRDQWTMEEIQTQQLEQKINSRAVFVLPWLVLIAITLQEGPFRDFYRSGAGVFVVFVGALFSGFGMWLVTKLSEDAPETRVFGGAASEDVG
jgi:tight adherence protein B